MKVKVIKQYIDKYTGEKHFPGEEFSVSAERMAELAVKGVIDKISVPEEVVSEDPIPEVPQEPEAPKKKAAAKKRTTRKKG